MDPGTIDPPLKAPSIPCDQHQVTISPVDSGNVHINIGPLCGVNTGQHLYIHLPAGGMVMPTVTFTFSNSLQYTYDILVTQVFNKYG